MTPSCGDPLAFSSIRRGSWFLSAIFDPVWLYPALLLVVSRASRCGDWRSFYLISVLTFSMFWPFQSWRRGQDGARWSLVNGWDYWVSRLLQDTDPECATRNRIFIVRILWLRKRHADFCFNCRSETAGIPTESLSLARGIGYLVE